MTAISNTKLPDALASEERSRFESNVVARLGKESFETLSAERLTGPDLQDIDREDMFDLKLV